MYFYKIKPLWLRRTAMVLYVVTLCASIEYVVRSQISLARGIRSLWNYQG